MSFIDSSLEILNPYGIGIGLSTFLNSPSLIIWFLFVVASVYQVGKSRKVKSPNSKHKISSTFLYAAILFLIVGLIGPFLFSRGFFKDEFTVFTISFSSIPISFVLLLISIYLYIRSILKHHH